MTSGGARSRASGTRRCWTRSGATRPRRRCTRGTSSTSRPRCGTRGPPTTRTPTATSWTRSTSPRMCRRARGGDQLRGLPDPPSPLLAGRGPAGDLRRARLDDGVALLPDRLHEHGGDSPAALGNRIAAAVIEAGATTGRSRRSGTSTRTTSRSTRRWSSRSRARRCATRTAGSRSRSPDRRAERHPDARQGADLHRPALGPRRQLRAARVARRAADRPGAAAAARRIPRRRCVQADRGRGDPLSSELDPGDGATVDIGPGARGDNTLGTNDGDGHDVNPATGKPYAPNLVPRADFARALAEFWADGPKSETPPGHWNTVANDVSDSPGSSSGSGATARRSTGSSGT